MANTSMGLWSPDATDPMTFRQTTAQMQASADTLFRARRMQTFLWASSADQAAQTGMVAGDEAFRSDTQATYKYLGGAWKLWDQPLTNYVPSGYAGLVVGDGAWACHYVVASGLCHAELKFTLGSTSQVNGLINVNLPLSGQDDGGTGTAYMTDTSASRRYYGYALMQPTLAFLIGLDPTGAFLFDGFTTSTTPFTWAQGDSFNMSLTYDI